MKKVLIIEDNPVILENTAELLEMANYRVHKAPDGRSGIAEAMTCHPDLILCDINMPDLDGYGVLHLVQKHPELRQIPFIFLTALTAPADIRKGMSLGADDFISQPYDATDLLNTIESRLKRAEAMQHALPVGLDGVDALISHTSGEEELRRFVEGRGLDRYKKKQRIYSEGNHPVRLYYVQRGKVKVYKTNDDGKDLIIKIVSEGEFFGYIAMLENMSYRENADALEDTEIAAILRSEFEELMNAHPEVTRKFIRLLASDVRSMEEQLLRIAYNSLRRKVADALLSVADRFSATGNAAITLTRENLAAVAGTATESLIRTLTDFKAERLIDIHEGKILILDRDKLLRVVH
ncbi:MAG: response regulator [Chitinophagaceae bacterium]|nr:MAG: response regulator [Chitinophagaceae bacterium]